MNWDAIGAIGELVGATAVVATLLYLSYQLRQNTKTTRLSSTQAVCEQLQSMFSLLASDESLAEIFNQASKGTTLTGAKKVRFNAFYSDMFRVYENAFIQRQEKALGDDHWDGMTKMMIDITEMASFPSYWENRKHWFSEKFQQHIEVAIVPVGAKTGIEIPGNY